MRQVSDYIYKDCGISDEIGRGGLTVEVPASKQEQAVETAFGASVQTVVNATVVDLECWLAFYQ